MSWLLALALACGSSASTAVDQPATGLADVVAVAASGEAGAYTFEVTVRSPDQNCRQYAQYWEVIDPTGASLHYRRILMHSHANEQPFTRSGGPVAVAADQQVIVRAHMKPGGYGGTAMTGTVAGGFTVTELADGFAAAVASEGPQIEDCAF